MNNHLLCHFQNSFHSLKAISFLGLTVTAFQIDDGFVQNLLNSDLMIVSIHLQTLVSIQVSFDLSLIITRHLGQILQLNLKYDLRIMRGKTLKYQYSRQYYLQVYDCCFISEMNDRHLTHQMNGIYLDLKKEQTGPSFYWCFLKEHRYRTLHCRNAHCSLLEPFS